MSQHDYILENQSGSEFRADLNNALAAIASHNSGASEPSNTFPFMEWIDTSTTPATIKQRNALDTEWVTIGTLSDSGIDTLIINDDNTPNLISAVARKDWTKGVAAFTGILAIEITGLYAQSAMNGVMEIDLMQVGSTKHFQKLIISGQWNNGTSVWDYGFADDLTGDTATTVRFARNTTTSKVYVLLGETSTVWTNTRVVISVPVSSWNSGLNLGFFVSTMVSLTGITTDITKQTALGVYTEGNQTIAGVKTFSSSPIVPTATTSAQAVNFGQVIGVGQTWQDVTASRSMGVTYTNNTGKPIVVSVALASTANNVWINVNGGAFTARSMLGVSCIVPDQATYLVGTDGTKQNWWELR